MIEAHGLCRRYGDFTAVEDVSFQLDEGEIVGILGPNGAGKTTTLRMVTGFLPPSAGHVKVAGQDLAGDSRAVRRQIGYLPENVALYPEMRVSEYLRYRARLEGLERSELPKALEEAVERCLLRDVVDQIIGTLSKGYRQRVGLAAAILHRPSFLVLDEPTVGLDPKQIISIRELIRELGERHTLLLSTHILPEVELLCSRVLIFDRGRIVAQGSPRELAERWMGQSRIRLELEETGVGNDELEEALLLADGIESAQREGAQWLLSCESGEDPRAEIFRLVVDKGWTLLQMTPERASLEDVFVRLTTQESNKEPAASDLEVHEIEEIEEIDEVVS